MKWIMFFTEVPSCIIKLISIAEVRQVYLFKKKKKGIIKKRNLKQLSKNLY